MGSKDPELKLPAHAIALDEIRLIGHDAGMSDGQNLPKVLSVLELLTEEELVQLNHVIVQRLHLMQQIRAHGAMVNLRIGQRVMFQDQHGQVIQGVISKHNRKSVTIVTETGSHWRVAPDFVRPVE